MFDIVYENPLSTGEYIPDIFVSYDKNRDRFEVSFPSTGSGYFMDRGNLVSEDLKYTDAIIREILYGIETEEIFEVLFNQDATKEVHMIWMANCDIF